ncbi:heparan sulfate glucosamine 3-O-sulfotransferase 1-like [Mya arenaria]|uniref:heparan sulfate glucosamine 3-O-sulfotransferase 1-like n=1 Tax=Mya arenaria TaxID=6604 RepID=UPI0022E14794|nr:heparan sulfate glucosamine 3-O-sulfotransferase 1-like [Mya arenaria]XP_052812095.1 heparan sulfate glucosamine 3-O-sulfotransferase 1-like [Mya arenaria]
MKSCQRLCISIIAISTCLWLVFFYTRTANYFNYDNDKEGNPLKTKLFVKRCTYADVLERISKTHVAKCNKGIMTPKRHTGIIRTVTRKVQFVNSTAMTHVKMSMECYKELPKCLIIGIQKCGTLALAEFLRIHPDIAIDARQTYFFSSNYSKGLTWYLDKLPCSQKGQITMERTPQYFYMRESPWRVFSARRDMKLLIIVCNPVKRTISNFAMAQYRNREHRNARFEEEVFNINEKNFTVNDNSLYVDKSRYAKHLQKWLEYFPRSQLHVIDGQRFTQFPAQELTKIERFLGLRPYINQSCFVYNKRSGFYCLRNNTDVSSVTNIKCLPPTKGRPHPLIGKTYLERLKQYFSPQNDVFFNLIMMKNWFQW